MAHSRKTASLNPRHKVPLYVVCLLLWLSGTLWLILPAGHPFCPPLLKIHGAAAMGFLVLFGSLLTQHVPMGWRQDDHRPSGASLLAACGVFILTGWGLYYIGDEAIRRAISVVHSTLGVLLPLLVFVHVRRR